MSTNADLFIFRPYTPDDVNFITNSWGISYLEGTAGHKQLTPDEFHHYHRPIRDKVMGNPNATAIVCASKEDPTTILGWILVEKNQDPYIRLHYLYTKATFQGEGIATRLMQMALPIRPVIYTHSTSKARRIMKENWKSGREDYSRFFFCPHLV